MGNFPVDRKELMDCIENATSRGIPIVVVSQCRQGSVASEYAVGSKLVELGVMLGADMTIETAVAKLSYLLGKGYKGETLKCLMGESLRGELTIK